MKAIFKVFLFLVLLYFLYEFFIKDADGLGGFVIGITVALIAAYIYRLINSSAKFDLEYKTEKVFDALPNSRLIEIKQRFDHGENTVDDIGVLIEHIELCRNILSEFQAKEDQ